MFCFTYKLVYNRVTVPYTSAIIMFNGLTDYMEEDTYGLPDANFDSFSNAMFTLFQVPTTSASPPLLIRTPLLTLTLQRLNAQPYP